MYFRMRSESSFSDNSQCDKATPSCSQCVRAHRTCPGYRDPLDLMFRIENEGVKAKSKAKAKGKEPRAPMTTTTVKIAEGTTLEDAIIKSTRQHLEDPGSWALSMVPRYNMSPTIEQRARGYFQTHSATWLRNYDLMDDLVSQAHGDEHLLATMSAVGLASFSNAVFSSELMTRARKEYVTALRLTNAALRSPTEVKKDSTLFAVMILSIFETVAGSNEESLQAWTEHVNGAAALVKLRGRDQFKTEAGQRMFFQVTSSLMISCIQRTLSMPPHIMELRKAAADVMDTNHPAWILSAVIIDVTNFRSAVRDCQLVGPRVIVKVAMDLEHRFIAAFENPRPDWTYEVRYTDEHPELVWDKTYHVYKDAWASQIWNGMRTCRILLHEIIRDQLFSSAAAATPVFSTAEVEAQEAYSMSIMIDMQRDILGSIQRVKHGRAGATFINANEEPLSLLESSKSAFTLWPLYLVGNMDVTSPELREWIITRLRIFGETIGIKQAGMLADFLAKGVEFWDKKGVLRSWRTGYLESPLYRDGMGTVSEL
jgi:hypothetical protein